MREGNGLLLSRLSAAVRRGVIISVQSRPTLHLGEDRSPKFETNTSTRPTQVEYRTMTMATVRACHTLHENRTLARRGSEPSPVKKEKKKNATNDRKPHGYRRSTTT